VTHERERELRLPRARVKRCRGGRGAVLTAMPARSVASLSAAPARHADDAPAVLHRCNRITRGQQVRSRSI